MLVAASAAAAASNDGDLCGPAELSALLRDHLPAVMQMLTNALPEYNMSMMTTKCLNTAVMTMYLMLGESALGVTRQCDVGEVRMRRNKSSRQVVYDDAHIAGQLTRSVFEPPPASPGKRSGETVLHYVMLTDGDMPKEDASDASASSPASAYFPGHVFVIERAPSGQFRLYQSYVDHYDVNEHARRRRGGSASISAEELRAALEGVERALSRPSWTRETSDFWSWFAKVPEAHARQFEGHVVSGVILMCHRRVASQRCALALADLVRDALERHRRDHRLLDPQAVWGDASLYEDADTPPLTNAQMVPHLTRLGRVLGVL